MTSQSYYTAGDTIAFSATLPRDLSTIDTVTFQMYDVDGTQVLTGDAVVLDAENGEVAYEFTETESDRHGNYKIDWELRWMDGDIETIPRRGYDRLYFKDGN